MSTVFICSFVQLYSPLTSQLIKDQIMAREISNHLWFLWFVSSLTQSWNACLCFRERQRSLVTALLELRGCQQHPVTRPLLKEELCQSGTHSAAMVGNFLHFFLFEYSRSFQMFCIEDKHECRECVQCVQSSFCATAVCILGYQHDRKLVRVKVCVTLPVYVLNKHMHNSQSTIAITSRFKIFSFEVEKKLMHMRNS